jgi:hypothetical protein
MWLFSHNH